MWKTKNKELLKKSELESTKENCFEWEKCKIWLKSIDLKLDITIPKNGCINNHLEAWAFAVTYDSG